MAEHIDFRNNIRKNLTSGSTWLRGFFMLLYAFFGYIGVWILLIVVLFQFGSSLVAGKLNERLLPFSQSLGIYISQILHYLTYSTEEKPFPVGYWPVSPDNNIEEEIVNLPKESEPPSKNE
ncbi:DUF4389 domain-containing protein [Candidatus Parabeggiatoa sp. HSG14]|uniref:DUF4389 domain-containing protein n=1 Tax=Candidatus Parabeggiatoa sp. HSG14 TaxID=3055593 RepID=UPI0025A7C318|nr:DUF4389 domain-containing protein [Thiotrichales bacterium HSG14]